MMHINQAVALALPQSPRVGNNHPKIGILYIFSIVLSTKTTSIMRYTVSMNIYRINPVGGSSGFTVHVSDNAGGLRVVGVFPTVADADAWIAVDSRVPEASDRDDAQQLSH
jgi:hypothetical protein